MSDEPTCRVVRGAGTFDGKQGLTYFAGISAESVGARGICVHMLRLPPGARARAHLHEAHETAIYVLSGRAGMWYGEGLAQHLAVGAGEYLYIPAGVPHQPYNPGPEEAVAVLARTDPNEQESVVLRPELDAAHPAGEVGPGLGPAGAATNRLGQPIGPPLPGWSAPPRPGRAALAGRYCRVEPLDPERHGPELFAANGADAEGRMWTYLAYGPFADAGAYLDWARRAAAGDDPLFFAIVDGRSGRAVGVASYLRIDPAAGSIEVGHIAMSPALQRSPAATEAMYLLMANAFALGYRRYEWKCDALNAPSRAAARRLGLSYEGTFRQATVYKGRSRDTAWFAAVDGEWPALRATFERWLDPANFDAEGRQRERLSELTAPLLHRRG